MTRVAVRVGGAAELNRRMGEMREWLDHRRVRAFGFNCSIKTDGTFIQLRFEEPDEAADFAAAFDGDIGSSAPDPVN